MQKKQAQTQTHADFLAEMNALGSGGSRGIYSFGYRHDLGQHGSSGGNMASLTNSMTQTGRVFESSAEQMPHPFPAAAAAAAPSKRKRSHPRDELSRATSTTPTPTPTPAVGQGQHMPGSEQIANTQPESGRGGFAAKKSWRRLRQS